ncbi:MAG: hypothetical protein QOJ12_692 [Thermoleophilales bacterium]|jgi:hypothetical protein|nr:hypothetical protein [Thermoleophilales bacterium]
MSAVAEGVRVEQQSMLIEQLLPRFDSVRREHAVVAGTVETSWQAVLQADFLEAWRRNPTVRALFALRAAAERAAAAARGRQAPDYPVPASMRLADMPTSGDWIRLGHVEPSEIAFGAVGRFWAGETAWEQIYAPDFASFDRPGFARIACNFSLRPYGADQTLVTYECRTAATDPDSRRAFLRYWRPLSPFIGVVLRSQLDVIARQAEQTE